jgi:nickel-dependent lactate racemase
MLYFAKGSEDTVITLEELKSSLYEALEKLGTKQKVLAIPPDFTRFHSNAGELTRFVWDYYSDKLTDILPALGTHSAMTNEQLDEMFGDVPKNLFRPHNWRDDIVTLGEVPADFVHGVSEGKVSYPWPAQVNKLLIDGGYDLILSLGQVVPHEVIGMANYNKNIFVGTGGVEGINKSHFLGAAYGMERIMGRADNPVRQVLNYASEHFAKNMPLVYVQTVVSRDENGKLVVRGLYIGDDDECFEKAAELSLKVNFTMLHKPLDKVVVYLDPAEFKSTWLGNKAIYRTRMAIADGGELVILAPGLKEFGEDATIDKLIRKYGYLTTPEILKLTDKNEDLQQNLSAAAHLIHGSSENRFKITYCPGFLSKNEIENVNFGYADLKPMMKLYDPRYLKDGFNKFKCGKEIYYISNPAIGLWASKDKYNL